MLPQKARAVAEFFMIVFQSRERNLIQCQSVHLVCAFGLLGSSGVFHSTSGGPRAF